MQADLDTGRSTGTDGSDVTVSTEVVRLTMSPLFNFRSLLRQRKATQCTTGKWGEYSAAAGCFRKKTAEQCEAGMPRYRATRSRTFRYRCENDSATEFAAA